MTKNFLSEKLSVIFMNNYKNSYGSSVSFTVWFLSMAYFEIVLLMLLLKYGTS